MIAITREQTRVFRELLLTFEGKSEVIKASPFEALSAESIRVWNTQIRRRFSNDAGKDLREQREWDMTLALALAGHPDAVERARRHVALFYGDSLC